jgi:sialic acid synthase SpsE
MPSIEIAGRAIGPEHEPYIVCELSGNHNGRLECALDLLELDLLEAGS